MKRIVGFKKLLEVQEKVKGVVDLVSVILRHSWLGLIFKHLGIIELIINNCLR